MPGVKTSTPDRDPRLDEPCAHPFELVNPVTAEIIALPCGSRLDDDCPSCAVRYQIVQRRILDEGQPGMPTATELVNGTAQLPCAVFLTLTLPSFGRLTEGHAPKYAHHYRYGDAVVAAAMEPELRRAYKEAIKRACADLIEAGMKLAFRGSREVQERGAGHYHLIVTLDPNTEDWDGKTRAPSGSELAERIEGVVAGTAAIPAELRTHLASGTVADRRVALDLPAPSNDTLRLTPRIRFGAQIDVQAINLHTDPTKDGHSFGRKAAYLSKALSYTVKDLGKSASEKAGRRNRAHLDRLSREAFAMQSDWRVTESVRRFLDSQIAERHREYAATRSRLDDRRPGLLLEMCRLRRVRTQLSGGVLRWNFLDHVTRSDISRRYPLRRFFGHRQGRVWVAVQVLAQLDLKDDFGVQDLRYLVKSIATALVRVVRGLGYTGSSVVSMNWPVTAAMIRAAQCAWTVAKLIALGELAFGPQLPTNWEPLRKPRPWKSAMAHLPPP